VFGIMRTVEQCYVAFARRFEQGLPRIGLGVQFLRVPAPELRPFLRIVRESFAHRIARRDVFEPRFHAQCFLLHAARPKTFDQETRAVCPGRRSYTRFVWILILAPASRIDAPDPMPQDQFAA
jgi:hypothetical protein